jgi:hypothetical protein
MTHRINHVSLLGAIGLGVAQHTTRDCCVAGARSRFATCSALRPNSRAGRWNARLYRPDTLTDSLDWKNLLLMLM